MEEKYSFETPRAVMTIREAFDKLDEFIDASDPDLDKPNLVHNL